MFRPCKIRGASCYGEYLSEQFGYGDYIAQENRTQGDWFGQLAKEWGLSGKTDPSDDRFRLLVDGKHPFGELRLTQRERDPDKAVRIHDWECSAPKSLSVLALFDERLKTAHDDAVKTALGEIEHLAARRVREGNKAWSNDVEITANLVGAVFRHETSRTLDPQIHSHCAIFNVTKGKDGKFYALTESEMAAGLRYAGKVYQNALGRAVRGLGYDLQAVRASNGVVEGWELKGVSPALLERFSKRSVQVEQALAKFKARYRREPNAVELRQIKMHERAAKNKTISRKEVLDGQLAQIEPAEQKALKKLVAAATPLPFSDRPAAEAMTKAIEHKFERASVLFRHDLLAEALNTDLGAVNLAELKQQVSGIVNLKSDPDSAGLRDELTTPQGLGLERRAVVYVDSVKMSCAALGSGREQLAEWLGEDQKEAIQFVLSNRDGVAAVRGLAGSGKTSALKELHTHLVDGGHRMLYLAPTRSAVEVLHTEGFTSATTVSDYLTRSKASIENASWRGAVIVIDEAGLQSNKQGAAVLDLARQHGNRIVFVGDTRQHVSVEAGDFLRVLETHSKMESRTLSTIRRQKRDEYRSAIREMARGNALVGMELLDEMGAIQERGSDYLVAAAESYCEKPEGSLLVCPTWAENHAVTQLVRDRLKEQGQIASGNALTVTDSLQWTANQKKNPANYAPGMLVTFVSGRGKQGETAPVDRIEGGKVFVAGQPLDMHCNFDVGKPRSIEICPGDMLLLRANDQARNLVNGEIWKADKVNPNGSIECSRETGEKVVIPTHFRSFTHGYAITSHKAQGKTCDRVIVAASRLDAKAAYVACSRGRHEVKLFTPEKATLLRGVSKTGDRKAALDLAPVIPDSLRLRATAWANITIEKVRRSVSSRLDKVRQLQLRFSQQVKMRGQQYGNQHSYGETLTSI